MEGKTPAYYTSDSRAMIYKSGQPDLTIGCVNWNSGYRLPTEAEWEFAARGGIASKGYKYSGGDDLGSVAWNDLDMTYDVGMKAPNELGIYDMSGNVWEWCLDDWDDNCYGPPADGSRQGDGTGENRVMRGGSGAEVTYRFLNWPDESALDVGFRVVYAVCSK